MNKLIVSFLFALTSISAFSSEFTGQLNVVCKDADGNLKTYTAPSIEITNGKITLLKWDRASGKYKASKPIDADCTIDAERGDVAL